MELLRLRHEGNFWDFKEYWYKNNADLVGDILNFANTAHHKDCYIIIGIEDKNFNIVGIEDDEHRKNTQNIVDLLRHIRFEGGRIPNVRVSTHEINEKLVDVITVINSNQVPFYLSEQYKAGRVTIPAGVIYSRIEDTNTSKNQSTNLNEMESLWKKRMQLDLTPGERLLASLKFPNKWIKEYSETLDMEYYYYRDDPTYQIQIKEDSVERNKVMDFSFSQENITITWYNIDLVIGGTKIFDIQGISLDGGRYFTVAPDPKFVNLADYSEFDLLKYYVLISDSLRGYLYDFFSAKQLGSDDARIANEKFLRDIIVIQDEQEYESLKTKLNTYLNKSMDDILPTKEDIEHAADKLKSVVSGDYAYDKWAQQILLTNNISKLVHNSIQL